MWMHAGRREQRAWMRGTELGGLHAVRDRCAGHDQPPDARGGPPREHGRTVHVEAVVRQIGANVDQSMHFGADCDEPRGARQRPALSYWTMRLTELVAVCVCCVAVTSAARAASPAELADLAGRIDYGFYNGDTHAIDAARTVLSRLGDAPAVRYYRDYAGLRRAQLNPADRASARECAEREVPAELSPPAAAEAWILVAACAVVGQQSVRRVELALARARELDKRNPRLGLVEAWIMRHGAGGDRLASDDFVAKLKQTVEAFDAWRAPPNAPEWGEAEALATLGDATLARGETRAARDLIERALLLAPDYGLAVELRTRLRSN